MALSRPLRLAIALWVVVGIAVSVRTLLQPHTHTIFPVLAASVEHWWEDAPLYVEYKPLDYFRYPPPFPVFFSTFAFLGPRGGAILWSWLSLCVYGAGLWAFGRRVLPVRWTDARFAVYLALGLFGGLRGLWNAQTNAFVVGLLLLGTAAIVERRWWRAGFLLGGATAVKLTPAAPVLLLCALCPLRLTPRFAVALALFAAVPFLTRPPAVVVEHYREWVHHLGESSHERWPGFRDAWTVWQVTSRLALGEPGLPPPKEPLDSPAYRRIQLLTAFAVFLWSQWSRWRGVEERELVTRTLAAGLAWLMLFGPSIEHATYVFLAPVLCWAFLEPGGGGRRALIGSAFVLVMVLGWGSLTRPLLDTLPLLLTALPVGTALFAVWMAGRAQVPAEVGEWVTVHSEASKVRSVPRHGLPARTGDERFEESDLRADRVGDDGLSHRVGDEADRTVGEEHVRAAGVVAPE
jgi:hypothetical protein